MTAIVDDFVAIRGAQAPEDMSIEELAAVPFEPLPDEAVAKIMPGGSWGASLTQACEFAGMVLSLPKSSLVDLVGSCLTDDRDDFKELLIAVKEAADLCREELPDLLLAAVSRAMVCMSLIATREPSDPAA
jgi:hypothetical protein